MDSSHQGSRTTEETFRLLIERGFNKGELAVVREITAPDFVEHQFSPQPFPPGPAALEYAVSALRTMMPEVQCVIEDFAVVGDKMWARLVATGTDSGGAMGARPTGKRVRLDVIDIVRVVNGKLVEHWGGPDRFAMLAQLGMLGGPR